MCPKRFPCPWYIRCKPCTNLVLRLTLSPNEPKWAFYWPMLPRSTIGCGKNDFQARGTFGPNRAPIVRWDSQYLEIVQNKLPLDPHHQGVPLDASKMIFEPMVCSMQTMHLTCLKINTISKRTKFCFHLTTTRRSTIGCAQNDFWASGTFRANRAPILRRD